MDTYDYLVLGGGSIGMAIAFKLASKLKNSKIAIIDYHIGSAASSAAGAMLGCFGEVTRYTFSDQAHRDKFDLMYAAHNAWPDWIKELEHISGEKIWHNPGTNIILNTQGGQLDEENFEAIISALKQYNEPFQEISPKNIEGLDAASFAKPLRAIRIEEGAVDSNQYLKVLQTACEKKNIQFINRKVDKIVKNNDLFTIKGNFDDIVSKNIILATGAFSNELLKNSNLGVDIMPIFSGVGFAMVTETKGSAFKHTTRVANRSGSCGLHIIPYGNDREYIGATNVIHTTPQHQMIPGMNIFLSHCAIEQLKGDIFWSNIKEYKVGNRPLSLDTFPLIGKTSLNGFFVATGTYRDGFHCSPIIAQDIANEIMGEKKIISDVFKPERKPIQTFTQEESIEDYALQSLSGAYEFWLKLPGIVSEKDMLNMYRQKAKDIYQQLQTDKTLNTDILFCLSMPTLPKNAMTELKNYLRK
ncbi:MAG: FAD-binding oxidoreductase [Candidatus Levybacteria bacterium]|nr:FAD-binding oxidoreductase [Candidatus Levybacteria bacterium]